MGTRVKFDKLVVAYVAKKPYGYNLAVIIDKGQKEFLDNLDIKPGITDGNSETKKGNKRPDFLKDKYLVTVAVRDWTIIRSKNIDNMRFDETLEYMADKEIYDTLFKPGMVIKIDANACEYKNNYGKFANLCAQGMKIYDEVVDEVANGSVDLDF